MQEIVPRRNVEETYSAMTFAVVEMVKSPNVAFASNCILLLQKCLPAKLWPTLLNVALVRTFVHGSFRCKDFASLHICRVVEVFITDGCPLQGKATDIDQGVSTFLLRNGGIFCAASLELVWSLDLFAFDLEFVRAQPS